MDREEITRKVIEVIAQHSGVSQEQVTVSSNLTTDLNLNPFQYNELRKALEKQVQVSISEEDFSSFESCSDICEFLIKNSSHKLTTQASTLNGIRHTPFEIGMPHTGRNNLCESPLLKLMGHIRWQHTTEITHVLSKDTVNDDGERLYPTIFYVEVAFPEEKPMSMFGENDQLTVTSTLRRYGVSMLDGEHFLFPADWPMEKKKPFENLSKALSNQIPYIRLTSMFVSQWKGAGWLRKSRPANKGFKNIREIDTVPDATELVEKCKETKSLIDAPKKYVPLSNEYHEIKYDIVPDRDLNGAGLLYFAHFPLILDICERKLLNTIPSFSFSEELLDRRTLVHRRSGYFSNASSRDTIRVNMKAWIENPLNTSIANPLDSPLRIFCNYSMHRESDGRLMMISSCEKTFSDITLGETPFADRLRSASL